MGQGRVLRGADAMNVREASHTYGRTSKYGAGLIVGKIYLDAVHGGEWRVIGFLHRVKAVKGHYHVEDVDGDRVELLAV